jgi:hypothetical protein
MDKVLDPAFFVKSLDKDSGGRAALDGFPRRISCV